MTENINEGYLETSKMSNNIMDVYLKKHKLDIKVIPSKNMIKLSDLRRESLNIQEPIDESKKNSTQNLASPSSENSRLELEDEEENSQEQNTNFGKTRKKREPSLKLQQKLNNQDLELIVSCVKSRQARVYIADVKKNEYVDKILKIQIISELVDLKLSNGKNEAFLKKSMFPKELNALFEAFVSSLCGQDFVIDERGSSKPILKCLVEGCDFKSLSEAEINRHIKRYTYLFKQQINIQCL